MDRNPLCSCKGFEISDSKGCQRENLFLTTKDTKHSKKTIILWDPFAFFVWFVVYAFPIFSIR